MKAPIGSYWLRFQLSAAAIGWAWRALAGSLLKFVLARGRPSRWRAHVQVSPCATDGDSFGGGSIGWRSVHPRRCAKTVTGVEDGRGLAVGWGRRSVSPMISWSVLFLAKMCQVRSSWRNWLLIGGIGQIGTQTVCFALRKSCHDISLIVSINNTEGKSGSQTMDGMVKWWG